MALKGMKGFDSQFCRWVIEVKYSHRTLRWLYIWRNDVSSDTERHCSGLFNYKLLGVLTLLVTQKHKFS